MSALADRLDSLTVEGKLYEKLADDSVRCFACGHRCLIREGKRGICQVRYNKGGKLFVPNGYVAALQSDPIEKKPFSHVLPGSNALTFGMLGCDYHCGYCFTGDTMVVTDRGPIELQTAFELGESRISQPDGDISFPQLRAVTSSGNLRDIKGVFRHSYRGDLVNIKPYYLPALRCTPDHQVFATDDISKPPVLVHARDLTSASYLAVPKAFKFSSPQIIDAERLLGMYQVTYQTPWKLSKDDMQAIMDMSVRGRSSREIGAMFGKSGSYIRHLRVKIRNGRVTDTKTSRPYIENGFLRFPNERQPGLPIKIELNPELAELLGYYCAEGSIVGSDRRPNSFSINFSFSKKEKHLADRVIHLLKD
ncbi:MAG: radical SAM protein, partial [Chloroflexi bacterium]|nr:radical SAM protein [Chloroflexota bacterium]